MLRAYLSIIALVGATGCKPRQEMAAVKSDQAAAPATDSEGYDADGYRLFKGLEAAMTFDSEFSDFLNSHSIESLPVCTQLVQKKDDPEGSAHLWWSRVPCPANNSLMPRAQLDFDFYTSIYSAKSVAKNSGSVVLKGLSGLMNAFGHADTRAGFVFDVTEPNQPIGYWVENEASAGHPANATLLSLCTNNSSISFLATYRFAGTCSLNANTGDKSLSGITFARPTPTPAAPELPPAVVERVESYQPSSNYSDNDTSFSDYDYTANRTQQTRKSFAESSFTERVARVRDITARAQLIGGDVSGFFGGEAEASMWRRDYRDALRYKALESISKQLSGGN